MSSIAGTYVVCLLNKFDALLFELLEGLSRTSLSLGDHPLVYGDLLQHAIDVTTQVKLLLRRVGLYGRSIWRVMLKPRSMCITGDGHAQGVCSTRSSTSLSFLGYSSLNSVSRNRLPLSDKCGQAVRHTRTAHPCISCKRA